MIEVGPTEGGGFSQSTILHKMQIGNPGSEVPPPKTRPYTQAERAIVTMETMSPRDRLVRMLATSAIDTERYRASAVEHPEMTEHYAQLEEANGVWADTIKTHYSETYQFNPSSAVDEARNLVEAALHQQ